MSLVLDSSVTLSWLFEDERSDALEDLLNRVLAAGAVVPSLWRYEMANGLQTAIRRKRIDTAYRDQEILNLAALDIVVDPDSDHRSWAGTIHLADRHELTVYDAAFLELAQRRRLPLATLDVSLTRAAALTGVLVVPGDQRHRSPGPEGRLHDCDHSGGSRTLAPAH